MPLVEKRYAQALLELSMSDLNNVSQEFEQLVTLYNTDRELREYLLDPRIKLDKKQALFRSIFESRLSKNLLNFVLLLLAKKRMEEFPRIYQQFIQLAHEKANILDMKVITAFPLDEGQLNKIKEKFRNKFNASSVIVTEIVDASIIGGVKVIIGDKVYDGSIKGRIESLTELVNI